MIVDLDRTSNLPHEIVKNENLTVFVDIVKEQSMEATIAIAGSVCSLWQQVNLLK